MRSNAKHAEALVVVRTAFQLHQAIAVLEKEAIPSFDLIYITNRDKPQDRHAFEKYRVSASSSYYVAMTAPRRDIVLTLGVLRSVWRVFLSRYPFSIGASFNEYLVLALLNRGDTILTVDDGYANYIKPEKSNLTRGFHNARGGLYFFFLTLSSYKRVLAKMERHYSLNPDICVVPSFCPVLKNSLVMEGEKIVPREASVTTFFIGQPFKEFFTSPQMERMASLGRRMTIDYYLLHPAEAVPALEGVTVADLYQNEIAEVRILKLAKNKKIRVVGWTSTTLFNMRGVADEIIFVTPKDSGRADEVRENAERANSKYLEF